jgi:hypothetical protein
VIFLNFISSRPANAHLTRAILKRIFVVALVAGSVATGQLAGQTTRKARSQLLTSQVPFSFPEKLLVGARGNIYLLDTDLSSLFTMNASSGEMTRMCGPDKLSAPSDIALDPKGSIWVLSTYRSKVSKLTPDCRVESEIATRRMPLGIQVNSFGELIVLKGIGDALFELYGSDGKLLRAFGQRLDYHDEATNQELSDGQIVPDKSGGIFFSFNYPPLIRHYNRTGNLISEFKPVSEVPIAPPDVSVRKQGNSVVVRSRYQILVLDMAVDAQGRLYLLLSGKNKVPALAEGTPKLAVFSGAGKLLKQVTLEHNFHKVAVGRDGMYVLRNRTPMRLDAYAPL